MIMIQPCTHALLIQGNNFLLQSIYVLQCMGVSVTPQSIYNKRKEMLMQHQEMMDMTVGAFVQQRKFKASAERYVSATGDTKNCNGVLAFRAAQLSPSTSVSTVAALAQHDGCLPQVSPCRLPNDAGFSMPALSIRCPILTLPPLATLHQHCLSFCVTLLQWDDL